MFLQTTMKARESLSSYPHFISAAAVELAQFGGRMEETVANDKGGESKEQGHPDGCRMGDRHGPPIFWGLHKIKVSYVHLDYICNLYKYFM